MDRTAYPGIFKKQLKSGGHSYVVVVQRPDRRQIKRSAPTLAAAKELQAQLKTEVASGEVMTFSRASFGDYANGWLQNYRGRDGKGIGDNTRENYRSNLKYAVAFLGKHKLVAIRPSHVRDYVTHLEANHVASYVRTLMIPVKAIFATAVEDEVIKTNPASAIRYSSVRANTEQEEENVKSLSEDELAAYIAATPDADRLLVEFMADTGVRIGEALALRWKYVDLGTMTFRVRWTLSRGRWSPTKSRHSRRTLPIPAWAGPILWQMRGTDEARVFGDEQYRVYRKRVMTAVRGVEGLEWVDFHTLRHTYASRLFSHGVNVKAVQKLLGHHSPAFTLETYIHLLPEDQPDLSFLDAARETRAMTAQAPAERAKVVALA